MHQRERTDGEIAWEELCWEGAALKMRSCWPWPGFYTEELYTEKLVHAEALTQRGLYTEDHLHREAFTYRSFYAKTLLHRESCTHRSFLHTETFTVRLHTEELYTQKLLHTDALTQTNF